MSALKKIIDKRKSIFSLLKKEDLPPLPSDPEINQELESIFSKILISHERKEQILNLSSNEKWRLIQHQRRFLEKNHDSIQYINQAEMVALLKKLKEKPTIIDLHDIWRWFLRAKEIEIRTFCIYDGVKFIADKLNELQIISKTTHNFRKQIEFLKMIDFIMKNEWGLEEVLKKKQIIYVLLNTIHVFHIELTSRCLEILSYLLWNSAESHQIMTEALDKIKNERNYKNRIDLFTIILIKSDNIIMLKKITSFINDWISSEIDDKKRVVIKSEFTMGHVENILEEIKIKIANNQFTIENTTEQKINDWLVDFNFCEKNDMTYSQLIPSDNSKNNLSNYYYSQQNIWLLLVFM